MHGQVAALARSSSPRRPGQRAPLPIKTHHGHVLVGGMLRCPPPLGHLPLGHPWQGPPSARAPSRGAPGGSGRRDAPTRLCCWAPRHFFGGSRQPPPKSAMPQPLALQVRPSVLKTVKHSEDLIIGEDSTFVRRVIDAGYRAVHTEEELSAYSHGSTISEQPGDKRRFAPAAVRREHYLSLPVASVPRAALSAPQAAARAAAMAAARSRAPSRSTMHAPRAFKIIKGTQDSGLSSYHGMIS
jgi:hypothetical protein